MVRTLSPMAKRGVVLEKALATDKLPPIVADERRLIQILSNIIGNALKFTEKVGAPEWGGGEGAGEGDEREEDEGRGQQGKP